MSQSMGAPSTIPPGSTVIFPDGTTGSVAAAGTITVPDPFVAAMQSVGFVFANATSLYGPALSISPTKGIGYAAGAGGAVTQATNKATGVTLNDVTGAITMNAAALNAGVEVTFTLTDSAIGANDVVAVSMKGGGTSGAYLFSTNVTAAGSCDITVSNASAGNLSEAIVLQFVVLRGAVA